MLTRYRDHWDAAQQTIDRRYIYTADDERIGILEPGEPTTWRLRGLDGKVLREFRHDPEPSEGWSWQTDWVHRGGQLLAASHADHGWRHFHLDHLGTPRVVTDSGGAVKSRHDYWPYGEEVTSPTIEVMKFTGHERDVHGGAPPAPMGPQGPTCSQVDLVDQVVSGSGVYIDCDDAHVGPGVTFTETAEVSIEAADDVIFGKFVIESGSEFSMVVESESAGGGGGGGAGGAGPSKTLDYMHARYYRPGLGRFLSVDPRRRSHAVRTPGLLNRYAYGSANPIKFTDPDGREVQYGSSDLQEVVEKAALRNARVRAVIEAFGPGQGRDLRILKGNPGKHPTTGLRRTGVTDLSFREATAAELLKAYQAVGGGAEGTAAAEALADQGIQLREGEIILESNASNHVLFHELGHVEQGLLDPEQAIQDSNAAAGARTDREYRQSASELYAEEFAREARKKDDPIKK